MKKRPNRQNLKAVEDVLRNSVELLRNAHKAYRNADRLHKETDQLDNDASAVRHGLVNGNQRHSKHRKTVKGIKNLCMLREEFLETLENYIQESRKTCDVLNSIDKLPISMKQRLTILDQRQKENRAHERHQVVRERLFASLEFEHATTEGAANSKRVLE